MVERYPHLAPELLALSGPSLTIWGEPRARHAALAAVASAWERADRDGLAAAIAVLDAAAVDGLAALGLPRGPVESTTVERVGRGWLGQERPECRLVLDGDVLASALRAGHPPDDIFRTWIHESLHARRPYALPATELRAHRGYEEGLVEGLARLATRGKAAMQITDASYPAYVVTYEAVAEALTIDVEQLWRALWKYPTGAVREVFLDVADAARHARSGERLTLRQRERLRGLADRAFASAGAAARGADLGTIVRTFGTVFR